MSALRLSGALVWFCSLSLVSVAADAPRPTLGHAPGVLAAREADGPWRVLHPGDPLPAQCGIETAAAGPCLVRFADAVLHVAPESQLQIDAEARRLVLRAGRVFLDVSAKDAWRIEAGSHTALLAAGSAAEAAMEASSRPSLSVTRGEVEVKPAGGGATAVAAGHVATHDPAKDELAARPLSPDESKRIAAWTSARKSPQGLGQLVVKDPQGESQVRLNVARYHVRVVLQPPVALVEIDQSFYNPYARQEEGQFIFNLPAGASVSRFAMYVTPSQLIEGELIERKQAAGIYQQIVSRKRDPAILEQIGDNLFKMRVFPIFAKDTKRILLDYTLPLETEGGECHFRLPLLSDLEPVWDFRLSGVVRGAAGPEAVTSVSHPELKPEALPDGTIAFDMKRTNYRPEADFSLSFARPGGTAGVRSYRAEPLPAPKDDKGRPIADAFTGREAMYFVAEVPAAGGGPAGKKPSPPAPLPKSEGTNAPSPPAPLPEGAESESPSPPAPLPANLRSVPGEGSDAAPADVLVLADTSSSIKDLGAVRRAVRQVVSHLRAEDRARLVCADVAPRPLHEGWLAPGSPQAKAALARLDEEFALGGTDLHASVAGALTAFEAGSGRRRLLIYVGDGQDEFTGAPRRFVSPQSPPGGATTAEVVNEAGAAFVGVCVQRSEPGRAWLESTAEETAGLAFDLAGDPRAAREWFRWLLSGMPSPEPVAAVAVEGAAAEDLYYPAVWAPGRPLYVYGRIEPAGGVKLSVTLGKGDRARTVQADLPVPKGQDDVFAGRLWAQKRLDQLRSSGFDDEAAERRVIALAQEWSLLTPRTAFLVLESEEDYARWNIDRRARRRYWKPADTRPEAPLPPEWLASVAPPEKPKKERTETQINKTAAEALRAELLRQSLGVQRGLFDPAARAAFDLRPGVAPLVAASWRTSGDFLRRHPCAEKLLQEVPLESVAGLQTLGDLIAMLRERCGGNVAVDRKALDDVGIHEEDRLPNPFQARGARPARGRAAAAKNAEGFGRPVVAGKTSLRSAVRFALGQLDLTLIEEPHRLLITTPEEAESRLATEVYPVADILFTDRVAELGLLADPYLDREEAARRRIEARLRRPMTVGFVEEPLADVVRHFARFLDGAVVIDGKALDDVGIGADAPVTASYRDVPAKEALEWILRDLDLEYLVQGEALVITTPEEAESRQEVRLHSGRGVLYEQPAPAVPPWQQVPWGGGGMGGMGGMAMGGGMGMGGFAGAGPGGMGGMGGGGGNMPAVVSVIPVVDGREAGLSSGGDPAAAQEEPAPAAPQPPLAGGGGFQADSDSVIDLITSTIKPTTWDDVGGPGSIAFFPYTLDFVFAQTREVHEQTEALFDRLRRMPPALGAKQGFRPATLPAVTPDTPGGPDFDSLIGLITSTVRPTSWDVVGGPGSIAPDWPRVAMIVSQTGDVHDELWRLLTLLRRSRYEAARGSRPWETAGDAAGGLFAAGTAGIELSGEARLSKLPPARPEELELLKVRREPAGAQAWRRKEVRPAPTGTAQEETLAVRSAGSRLELVFPHGTARIEGDQAAVAWPELMLVEHGNSGEALRQAVDAWLPWMPHRSNEEIARVFEVRVVGGDAGGEGPSPPAPLPKGEGSDEGPAPLPDPEGDRESISHQEQPSPPAPLPHSGEGSETPSPPNDLVRLRLVPAGFAADQPDTYFEAAFSRMRGLPVAWESYVGGKLTGRLRFSRPAGEREPPGWKRVVLEDADAKELVQWDLDEAAPGDAAGGAAPPVEIPELTAGWEGCVQLDRRAEKAAVDPALRPALAAIQAADWPEAVKQLNAASAAHPRHPLVQLLYAWCFERDPSLGAREHMLAMLREAAAGPAAAVPRFVAEGHFTTLTAGEVYGLASLQPEATRTAEDCDRLAAAAVAAGKLPEALKHAEAALAKAPGDETPRAVARERTRVELLLKLGPAGAAVQAAREWATGGRRAAGDLAAMAELLARYAQRGPAEEISALALADEGLSAGERYQLLRRRADLLAGYRRLEALAEAAALKPAGSEERAACAGALLAELSGAADAESAARLAAATPDADLKAGLLVREAELLRDAARRSDVLWEVYRSGRLGDERLAWAGVVWNEAEKHERVILACEARLRAGKPIVHSAAVQLARAYRAAGRDQDAGRAGTWDPEPPVDVPPPGPRAAPQQRNNWQGGGGFF